MKASKQTDDDNHTTNKSTSHQFQRMVDWNGHALQSSQLQPANQLQPCVIVIFNAYNSSEHSTSTKLRMPQHMQQDQQQATNN